MNKPTCPYCDAECHPDDDNREQDVPIECECPNCGKTFIYYITYYPFYTEQKADCLNGSEHDYQPIMGGYPEEYFANIRRCSMCQKEINIA